MEVGVQQGRWLQVDEDLGQVAPDRGILGMARDQLPIEVYGHLECRFTTGKIRRLTPKEL